MDNLGYAQPARKTKPSGGRWSPQKKFYYDNNRNSYPTLVEAGDGRWLAVWDSSNEPDRKRTAIRFGRLKLELISADPGAAQAFDCYSDAPMTAIRIQGLTKRFGRTTAVNGIDLTINSGDLFFLLGPSGCGKTTLLRMIAGFIDPTAGSIHFDKKDVTHVPPNKRNTGMVFQSYALWPHMSVADNVGYGLNVRKITGSEPTDRIEKALKSVRMEEYGERKPNQLSGGQQQRVALARALVIEPTVLLLDEPLSNLDARLRMEMRSEIRRICTETGITTVYVTHDQKEALSMADGMAVLRTGDVMQVGKPREVYDRPNSRFVSDFLGETNFIPGVVTGAEAGKVHLDTPLGPLVSCAGIDTTPSGGNVTCSIRPEALSILDEPSADNGATGTCVETMYLGEVAQHTVEVGDGTLLKVLEMNPTHLNDEGHTMHMRVRPESVVILPD